MTPVKISEAKNIVASIVKFNLQCEREGKTKDDFIVPILLGPPGVGKTAIPRQVARELNIGNPEPLVAHQYDPGELAGFPMPDYETKTMYRFRPNFLPSEGTGVLILDEAAQGTPAHSNIIAQLVNEWRLGDHHLGSGWSLVLTGNRQQDRAATHVMPTHLKDRLLPIEIAADVDDFIRHAINRRFDPVIMSHIAFWGIEALSKFDPHAFSCPSPRSWEKENSVLKLDLTKEQFRVASAGTLGESEATRFIGHKELTTKLPTIEQIAANPKSCELPTERQRQFTLAYMIAANMTVKNVGACLQYLERLPDQELTVFVVRCACDRLPGLDRVGVVTDWLVANSALFSTVE